MANTGNILNPKVQQVYTSGPFIGTGVNIGYDFTFTPGVTESVVLCDETYIYKEYRPDLCPPDVCAAPNITDLKTQICGGGYNFRYDLFWNPLVSPLENGATIFEYSLSPSFSGETGSIQFDSPPSSSVTIDISDGLTVLPLNGNTRVYFRAYNKCSLSTPTYSAVKSYSCLD